MKQNAIPMPGTSVQPKFGTWIQTERKTHDEWARLTLREPKAAQLVHHLVLLADSQNELSITQKVLAERMGCGLATVKRALKVLVDENWVKTTALDQGQQLLYTINDHVGWTKPRRMLSSSKFRPSLGKTDEQSNSEMLRQTDQPLLAETAQGR